MTKRKTLRIAAAGDIHLDSSRRGAAADSFARLGDEADLVLLAGDLTTYGEPEQAEEVVAAFSDVGLPVLAVLGNHDWHAGRRDEVVALLDRGGIVVLERSWTTLDVAGLRVGVVGTKGFVGGFPDASLPDFGEPVLREVYAETTAEVAALEGGLEAIAGCDVRLVLLHYSPTQTTVEGEPPGIWAFLGSDRLARPIAEHTPDLVVHGHCHAGTFEGFVGRVPVYNVSVPVLGRDYWLFELDGKGGLQWPAAKSAETTTTRPSTS